LVATIVEIPHLRYRKVAYYTIYVEGRERSEFLDFQTRMKSHPEFSRSHGQLNQFLKDIGQKHGAKKAHFRHERNAVALPPPYYIQPEGSPSKYGLRLYCLRLSEEVVILLNGGLKTNDKAGLCPNCKPHFDFANKIAQKVDEIIVEGNLWLDGRKIMSSSDEDLSLFL
jgi:hypothetical protein